MTLEYQMKSHRHYKEEKIEVVLVISMILSSEDPNDDHQNDRHNQTKQKTISANNGKTNKIKDEIEVLCEQISARDPCGLCRW